MSIVERHSDQYDLPSLGVQPILVETAASGPDTQPQTGHFFEAIGRPDLHARLTPRTPFGYLSMEFYDKEKVGLKGGGGLGVLAGDTRRLAEQLHIPLVTVTPFYSQEVHQDLDGFQQTSRVVTVTPEEEGFTRREGIDVSISTRGHERVPLQIWEQELGSTRVVTVYEPNMGSLYAEGNSSDKRLYQDVALGFGGHEALKQLGLTPPVMQLNEAPTVLAAIAELDDLAGEMDFDEALSAVREKTIYTNHTLVQAVESKFSNGQFEHFVMPNIRSDAVKEWVRDQFMDGEITVSRLAIELSHHEKRNGVSVLHSEVANYKDARGESVVFEAVTNGISLEEWVNADLLDHYRDSGLLTAHDLPADDYLERLGELDPDELRALKQRGREEMNEVLSRRQDQYGNPIEIPDDATVFDFKRRFASYKRPTLLFSDPERLAGILEEQNGHLIITGKAHPNDGAMIQELERMLHLIDGNPVLKSRVHYIKNYDEEVGRALAVGGDVAINLPIVGEEACGTSWEKDIMNLKVLISTNDGGVADIQPPACLVVAGNTEAEELESAYSMMIRAGAITRDNAQWNFATTQQLANYLPIISGPRMMRDYLAFAFPTDADREQRAQRRALPKEAVVFAS